MKKRSVPAQFDQAAARLALKHYRDIPNYRDRVVQLAASPAFAPAVSPGAVGRPGFRGGVPGSDRDNEIPAVSASCGAVSCLPISPRTLAYERVVGLPRVCVGGGDRASIETIVCGPFTLTGLYIPPQVAQFLSITRLEVACENILVNCDPIPAELFSCCEIDEYVFTAPAVEANSVICIEVENESRKELEFKGALKGLFWATCD